MKKGNIFTFVLWGFAVLFVIFAGIGFHYQESVLENQNIKKLIDSTKVATIDSMLGNDSKEESVFVVQNSDDEIELSDEKSELYLQRIKEYYTRYKNKETLGLRFTGPTVLLPDNNG